MTEEKTIYEKLVQKVDDMAIDIIIAQTGSVKSASIITGEPNSIIEEKKRDEIRQLAKDLIRMGWTKT